METLNAFQDEAHQPFTLAGENDQAALLVHGFPGTPAEMRPLATALHQAGWTVEGMLLPGFGPQINTLFEHGHDDWVAAVKSRAHLLQETHRTVLLIGYSMGAALSMSVAAKQPPTGLVLIAPFQQFGTNWQRLVGRVLKPFFRHVQPFKDTDFSDPDTRQGIANFFDGVDLDDPKVQETIRALKIPTRILEQLNRAGQVAQQVVAQVTPPTLIVQGTQDEVVAATATRRLIQTIGSPIQYLELPAGHDILNPDKPCWSQVEVAVVRFAESLCSRTGQKKL